MEGGNGNEKNLPLEPRSGSKSLAVGFNPRSEANGITQFADRRTEKIEACIPKRRSRKPPLDVARPRATTWRRKPSRNAGVHENLENVESPPVQPVRGNPLPLSVLPNSLRRSRKPYWIADVSPPKNFSHKERKETIGANTD